MSDSLRVSAKRLALTQCLLALFFKKNNIRLWLENDLCSVAFLCMPNFDHIYLF